MPAEQLPGLQAQLSTLKDRLTAIRLEHAIWEADRKGIRPLIDSYTDDALYLRFLNDIPSILGHYGQAVAHLNEIEHHQPLPNTSLSRWPWIISGVHFFSNLKRLLNINYESGEDIRKLYNQLWWFHFQAIDTTAAIKILVKAAFSTKKRLNIKATILLMYAGMFKSEDFDKYIKQPLKEYCLMLLDRMEELIGKGAVVQPDSGSLIGDNPTELFVRVSRDFDDQQLNPDRLKEVLSIKERMIEIQKQMIEYEDQNA